MDSTPSRHRPTAFVIRIEHGKNGLRGQVVAVATGAARLFDDLPDAMAFIKAQIDEGGLLPADEGRAAE